MDKVLALLAMTELRLSAEEKYFLIRLICVYDHEGLGLKISVDKTVLELEAFLGMSDNLIKKTRESLIDKKYLSRCPMPSQSESKRGRPRAGFFLPQMMIDVLSKSKAHMIDVDHIPRIKRLLMWDAAEEKKEESAHITHLTPANRIVLALMYSRANGCGAIHDLGVMQLAKLSGLKTKDRTESQLEKLTQLGYILDRVSGISGKVIWKKLATGAFFLNVLNDQLMTSNKAPVLLLMNNNSLFGYQGELASNRMINTASLKNDLTQETNHAEFKVATNFEGESLFEFSCRPFNYVPAWDEGISDEECEWMTRREFVEGLKFALKDFRKIWYSQQFMEYKINRYASLMLSQHWEQIQSSFTVVETVMSELRQDILAAKFREKLFKDNPHAQANLSAFELCFYRLAFEAALLTKGLIKKIFVDVGEKVLSQSDYEILLCPYIKTSCITQYGVMVKFEQEDNSIKAITLDVKYSKSGRVFTREIEKHLDYCFIKSKPWSLFGLNIQE